MKKLTGIFVALGATLALVVACDPVAAQQANCLSYEDMREGLTEQYGEQEIASGLSNAGHLVTFWGNIESNTFTVVVTDPNGTSCIVDAGEAFAAFPIGAPA